MDTNPKNLISIRHQFFEDSAAELLPSSTAEPFQPAETNYDLRPILFFPRVYNYLSLCCNNT